MSERCLTLGCPEAIRLALQDPCTGLPTAGEDNGAVISCIRNWTIEPIVREGEASEFTADCGNMVVRDRQDDQLLGYTISFESSIRSVELEALVTGKELIPSGGNNIGTYGIGSNLGCTEPSEDPRLTVEAFYKLSRCVSGADHVRVVLPMGQFKVTELDREGTITFFRYTAETSVMPVGSLGNGPFNDFPADIVAFLAGRDPEELTTGLDFEEVISISGACGTIEVPSDVNEGPGFNLMADAGAGSNGSVDIAVNPDGSYLSAAIIGAPGDTDIGVYKFQSNGNLDTTFGVSGLVALTLATSNDIVAGIEVDQNTGSIYLLATLDVASTPDVSIIKLTSAGALDATFGVGGIKSLSAGAGRGATLAAIFVETTGEVVAGYNTALDVGHIRRVSTLGVDIDDVTLPHHLHGAASLGADSLYALALQDLSVTGDIFAADVDIDTATTNTGVVSAAAGTFQAWTSLTTSQAIGVSTDAAGNIFLSGANGGTARVAKVDNTLVLDVTFDGDGFVDIVDGAWASGSARMALPLTGGNLIVSGVANNPTPTLFTARITSTGALVGSYGTAGIENYAPAGTTEVTISTSILQEANDDTVHIGSYEVGADTIILRTKNTDGALDLTFG